MHRLHARHCRQDLFQEIAIAIWTALPNFRAEASERTWLYRIAHNVALTSMTKQRRQNGRERPIEALSGDPVAEDDLRHRALLEAVQQLNPAERNIVLLYLEGLSGREIAEVTGLSVDNIGVRLSRVRQKLTLVLRRKEIVDEPVP
jgi:RNA polymerase sigma-70 factor (ECF subfamily)